MQDHSWKFNMQKKKKKKYIYDKYSALKFDPTHGQCIWDRYMCLLNVKLSD